MADRQTYHQKTAIDLTLKLREVLATLPPFVRDYFRAIDASTSPKTRLSYAYDIRIFFQFLRRANPLYAAYDLRDFTLEDIDRVNARDIEEYLEFLKVYVPGDSEASEGQNKPYTNGERGLKRKISSLRSFYAYYYRQQMITTNPTVLVDMPKVHERTIVRLEAEEVAALLDHVEHAGDTLTGQARAYFQKTKERDLALITLLLGTGIRVSECVGLDIEDVDFRNNGIRITRKGGNDAIV